MGERGRLGWRSGRGGSVGVEGRASRCQEGSEESRGEPHLMGGPARQNSLGPGEGAIQSLRVSAFVDHARFISILEEAGVGDPTGPVSPLSLRNCFFTNQER